MAEKDILFSTASKRTADSTSTIKKSRTYGSTSKSVTTTSQKTQMHKVRPSDTLVSLAIKYETSVEELKRLNTLWSNESLQLKSSIKVPVTATTTAAAAAASKDQTPTEPVSLEQFVSEEDEPRGKGAENQQPSAAAAAVPARHSSKASIARSKTFANDKDFSEMDSNEFLRKFDMQFMQLKTSVEKMENESSLSEEDSAYSCMPRRSTTRYMSRQAFRSSEPEQMLDGPDVLANPELVVRSQQLPETEETFYKL